jgi:endonuclease/exonuclease/phosphatase family metal-dependent hydrolase
MLQVRVIRWLLIALEATSLMLGVGWSIGRLAGDRWTWSQWLFWIPSITLLPLAIVSLAWLVRAGRRSRCALQVGIATMALVSIARNDLGMPSSDVVGTDGVRVLQWNTSWPTSDAEDSLQALARNPADIVLISNRGAITSPDQVRRWAAPGARVVGAGPFALVTRFPIREARQVAAGGGPRARWWVARFEIEPPGWNGRTLRIAMVDLPSRPALSREAVAEALLHACDEGSLGEVDMVAGDFNATDGSVILTRCFPGFRDSLREAGQGWLATWPRRFPLWRIDHLMISGALRAVRGRVVDPGIGSHRMSEAVVAPD